MRVSLALLGLVGSLMTACDSRLSGDAVAEVSGPTVQSVAERGVVDVGQLAPDFKLWDLRGRQVSLSEYRGKVVLVNFWATWCGPCRVEMPAMEALYRDFDRRDFEILAISTDEQGAAATRPFSESIGLTFPILHDADYQVGLRYGARTLPMSFLVNRQGVVIRRVYGARDWHSPEAKRVIDKLLRAT
jgi:peroxiredoxin